MEHILTTTVNVPASLLVVCTALFIGAVVIAYFLGSSKSQYHTVIDREKYIEEGMKIELERGKEMNKNTVDAIVRSLEASSKKHEVIVDHEPHRPE